MKLDLEGDFLQPFRDKKVIPGSSHQGRYVGLGKLIDATVNFAVKGHAYTFMNLCLAQLNLYAIEPNEGLLSQSRRVFDYLLANDGLIASGTCSRGEGWQR